MHFEIAAGVGNAGRGTWDMTVTLPGRTPRQFKGLQNGNAKFSRLTWLGFSSNATRQTVFYLDNIKLTNEA